MRLTQFVFIALSIFIFSFGKTKAQSTYYPPTSQMAFWDTVSPKALGWCTDSIRPLYQYLQNMNSKAFILLVDGKIALEKYFGTFTKDSVWYWASAGKTLTAFLVGKAQQEGKLKLSDRTSDYLGAGWSSLTTTQENAITIKNQITMTSGLDDGVPDNHCTDKSCLIYKADAGTRWAYHNAPYTMLDKVIETATGVNLNTYTQQKISAQTGINGLWFKSGYANVFASKARNFARWGLLAQNGFRWNGVSLIDTAFARQSVNTSQNLNLSYGYLWWLNGKKSFMVPTLQTVFPGNMIPFAPNDCFSAIGKNAQIASISPSRKIVWVRMGDAPGGVLDEVPFMLADKVWKYINSLICNNTGLQNLTQAEFRVYPNPVHEKLNVNRSGIYRIADAGGRILKTATVVAYEGISTGGLKPGTYFLLAENGQAVKFTKQP